METNLFFGQPKPWGARDVGISGLGSNPTNPWCQRPRRPPLQIWICELLCGLSMTSNFCARPVTKVRTKTQSKEPHYVRR